MNRWVREVWIGSELIEFESAYRMDESIERLKAASARSIFSSMGEQKAVGSVTRSGVSLQRVIPMVQNSFKPFFRGQFVERRGKVILTGRFTLHWAVKIFMAVWFSGVLLACLGIAAALLTGRATPNPSLLIPFGMVIFGIVLVGSGRWFARNDVAWLSKVIQGALRAPDDPNRQKSGEAPTGVESEKSPAMTFVATALAAMALVIWVTCAIGIPPIPVWPEGKVVAPLFTSLRSPQFAGPYGAFLLILAYGVFRRHEAAWRAGFVFLALGWGSSIVEMWVYGMGPLPTAFKAAFAAVMGLVMLVWTKWWYDQRIHFKPGSREVGTVR